MWGPPETITAGRSGIRCASTNIRHGGWHVRGLLARLQLDAQRHMHLGQLLRHSRQNLVVHVLVIRVRRCCRQCGCRRRGRRFPGALCGRTRPLQQQDEQSLEDVLKIAAPLCLLLRCRLLYGGHCKVQHGCFKLSCKSSNPPGTVNITTPALTPQHSSFEFADACASTRST